jgi:hypothetical protein
MAIVILVGSCFPWEWKYIIPFSPGIWGFSWEVCCYSDRFNFVRNLLLSIFFFVLYSWSFNYNIMWKVLFWSCLFVTLSISWSHISISFLRFGKLSDMISVNRFSMPLVCSLASFSKPKIHKFDQFIMSQKSPILWS